MANQTMVRSVKTVYLPTQLPSRSICGFGLGVSLIWFLADIVPVLVDPGETSSQQRLLGIMMLAGMAILAGAVGQIAASLAVLLGRLFSAMSLSIRCFLSSAPFALGFFVLLAPRLVDLLSGDWVVNQPWRPIALVGTLCGSFIGSLLVGAQTCRIAIAHGRLPTYFGMAALGLTVLVFALDAQAALARRHQAIHDILAIVGLIAAGLFGSSVLGASWRKYGLFQVIVGTLTLACLVTGIAPGESGYLRRLLYKGSRLSSRVLDGSAKEVVFPTRIDQQLLHELGNQRRVNDETLDDLIPGRKSRDIVLVTIDTLRRDIFDSERVATLIPNLDRQMSRSVQFAQAWTPFPSSRLAMHGMFTGHYPTASSIYEGSDAAPLGEAKGPSTLAAALAEIGYETQALTSFQNDFFEREKFHLLKGFSNSVNDQGDPISASSRVVERAIQALGDDQEGGPPRFLWVHLFDPHEPYRERADTPPDASKKERYQAEVRHSDKILQRLFEFLRFSNRKRVVIVHSDHGEEFGDHGGMGHHSSLYQEQIAVPLALSGPGFVPRRVNHPVSLIDLPATICALTGAPTVAGDKGHSLLPQLLGLEVEEYAPAAVLSQFREPRFVHGNLDAVRDERWKLIHDRRLNLFELYDLENDPQERMNVIDLFESQARHMKVLLATMRAHAGLADFDQDGGARALIEKAIEGFLTDEEVVDLADVLRREEVPCPELIPDLLSSNNPAIRRAALIHVATYANGLGRATLTTNAFSGRGALQEEASVGVALLGDGDSPDALRGLDRFWIGDDRFILLLARFVSGSDGFDGAVNQLLADPNNDRDIDTLAIYSLLRAEDQGMLPSLYARTNLGWRFAEHRRAALRAATALPFSHTAPLVRRFLTNGDRSIRAQTEDLLAGNPKLLKWKKQAVKAEAVANRARALGLGLDTLREATAFYLEALAEMARVDVYDWGYVMELAFLWLVNDKRDDLGDLLAAGLPKEMTNMNQFAVAVAERFIVISRTAGLPVRARIRLLDGQEPKRRETGRINLLVELELGEDGEALVGGIGTKTSYLGAVVLDNKGRPLGEPLSLPLPLTGVLPGEKVVLAVPIFIPEDAGESLRLGIRLGRADDELIKPLVIDVLRQN